MTSNSFRSATEADFATVRAFQLKAYSRIVSVLGSTPMPMEWDYAALLPQCEIWLTEDEGGLTGVLILRPTDDHLYIESIATAKRAAGSGLGRTLMAKAVERAKELGLPHVRLTTNAKNPAAEWYLRLGFAIERQEDFGNRIVMHFVKAVSLQDGMRKKS